MDDQTTSLPRGFLSEFVFDLPAGRKNINRLFITVFVELLIAACLQVFIST